MQEKTPSRLGLDLQLKVAELESALLERHPKMPVLLREIHTALRLQPENVTLMNEDEIAIIVSGLSVQTSVEFAKEAVKPAGKNAKLKEIAKLGLDAI